VGKSYRLFCEDVRRKLGVGVFVTEKWVDLVRYNERIVVNSFHFFDQIHFLC